MIEFEASELNSRIQIGELTGEESYQLGLDDESAPVAHIGAQHVVATQIYTIARRDREDVEYVLTNRALKRIKLINKIMKIKVCVFLLYARIARRVMMTR